MMTTDLPLQSEKPMNLEDLKHQFIKSDKEIEAWKAERRQAFPQDDGYYWLEWPRDEIAEGQQPHAEPCQVEAGGLFLVHTKHDQRRRMRVDSRGFTFYPLSSPCSPVPPEQKLWHAQNPNAFCLVCKEHPCKLISAEPPANLIQTALTYAKQINAETETVFTDNQGTWYGARLDNHPTTASFQLCSTCSQVNAHEDECPEGYEPLSAATPTPVEQERDGFADLLPLAAVRIAPGEYEVKARDGRTLWRMEGASLADWVCASVNGYDAALNTNTNKCEPFVDWETRATLWWMEQQPPARFTACVNVDDRRQVGLIFQSAELANSFIEMLRAAVTFTAARGGEDQCAWTLDDSNDGDFWETGCGEAFQFTDGGPADNKFVFCYKCGRRISVGRYSDDAADSVGEEGK